MSENSACSSKQSNPVQERKKKGLSKQNALYSVVKFNVEFNDEENETYSVIPTFWLKEVKYTYWPKKDVRNCIIKRKTPRSDWTLHPVTIIGKYDSYEQALKKEKRLMDDKNTKSENNLGRGFRQKKLSYFLAEENVNSSDSSKTDEQENSDNSIPELDETLHEQYNDGNKNVCDDNYLDIDKIPIVIDDTRSNTNIPTDNYINETLSSILRYVIDIKMICKQLGDRLHILENANHTTNTYHNTDMLPHLPMNEIEDINNFEVILASEEAQSQLVSMLVMIGGVTTKDALKRALQKLFSNNLASKYSWTGAKDNFKLKELKIITCIKIAIKKTCPTTTEAEFEEILKTWFRQANLRLTREKAKNKTQNNTNNTNNSIINNI